MRNLPFTDEDIGDCLGRVTVLHNLGFADMDVNSSEKCLEEHFGLTKRVAFGSQDGAGTKAWGTAAEFLAALRADIAELLTQEHRSRSNDISKLFQVIYNPRLMFEFEPFKLIFARELIPTQVLDQRSFILFNPFAVYSFGNP